VAHHFRSRATPSVHRSPIAACVGLPMLVGQVGSRPARISIAGNAVSKMLGASVVCLVD